MISTSVKSIFLLAILVTLNHYVDCSPSRDDFYKDRIVGGYYAEKGQFPFMVVVHRLLGRGLISQCGGTILSHRWVLTAGHCVGTSSARFLLVFGIINKSGIGYDFYDGPGLSMMTEESYLHPDFDPSINDIGLLRTPMNIPFGENIQPIQLVGLNDIGVSFANRMSIVVGWGIDGQNRPPSRRLKFATLPIISNDECRMYWAVTTDKHVCTDANYGQDACQGDSGGPLIVLESSVPLQIGVVSYGNGYCPSDKPGVFSRVSGYIDWIQEVTGLQF